MRKLVPQSICWKKLSVIAVTAALLGGFIFLVGHVHDNKEINYVGMTRDQIIAECDSYDRFQDGKIMIFAQPVFYYFNSTREIYRSKDVMNAKKWGINFRDGVFRRHFHEIEFENDVVVRQTRSCYGDF